MRLPLHHFFGKVLSHFGIAPCQLLPNGWRVLVGFVVLCHHAAVPPSLAVFRHFFAPSRYSLFYGLSPSPRARGHPARLVECSKLAIVVKVVVICDWCVLVMEVSANDAVAKNLRAQRAATAATVRSEPERGGKPCTPSFGKKRKMAEDDTCDWSSGCSELKGPSRHSGGGGSAASDDPSFPPGFFPVKPPPTRSNNGKAWCECAAAPASEGEWKAARQLLQGIVTPSREGELAASRPADVVASSYLSLLQVKTCSVPVSRP